MVCFKRSNGWLKSVEKTRNLFLGAEGAMEASAQVDQSPMTESRVPLKVSGGAVSSGSIPAQQSSDGRSVYIFVYELKRSPKEFLECIVNDPQLAECWHVLETAGLRTHVSQSGAKLFLEPEIFSSTLAQLHSNGVDIDSKHFLLHQLRPRHIVASEKYRHAILNAVDSLPKRLQIKIKSSTCILIELDSVENDDDCNALRYLVHLPEAVHQRPEADILSMPPLHALDLMWLSTGSQVEFVVDSHWLADIMSGSAVNKIEAYHETARDVLKDIYCIARYIFRGRAVQPIVVWRSREYNCLADALCNYAMDHKSDYDSIDIHSIVSALQAGNALQFHSDGGMRSGSCGAYAFSVTRWQQCGPKDEWMRSVITRAAFFVDSDVTFNGMELRALAVAVRTYHDLALLTPPPVVACADRSHDMRCARRR